MSKTPRPTPQRGGKSIEEEIEEQDNQGGKMRQVNTLRALKESAENAYIKKRLASRRLWLLISKFKREDGREIYRVRVSTIVPGEEIRFTTLVNISSTRLNDILELLAYVKKKMDEVGIPTSRGAEEEEELL